jgi:hypothetical protein
LPLVKTEGDTPGLVSAVVLWALARGLREGLEATAGLAAFRGAFSLVARLGLGVGLERVDSVFDFIFRGTNNSLFIKGRDGYFPTFIQIWQVRIGSGITKLK